MGDFLDHGLGRDSYQAPFVALRRIKSSRRPGGVLLCPNRVLVATTRIFYVNHANDCDYVSWVWRHFILNSGMNR